MPLRNATRWLREAVESVLDQGFAISSLAAA
jgi:hypothetical protein